MLTGTLIPRDWRCPRFRRRTILARKMFGGEYMKTVSDRVHALLLDWGYNKHGMSDRNTPLMTDLKGEMGW